MSALLMGRILTEVDLEPLRKLLLVKLADHADDQGRHIWPSHKRLAHETRVAERTVRKILAELCEAGILEVVARENPRAGRAKEYRLHLQVALERHPLAPFRCACAPETEAEPSAAPGAANAPDRRHGDAPSAAPERTIGGTGVPPNHHRTIREPNAQARAREGAAPAPACAAGPEGEDGKETLAGWWRAFRNTLQWRSGLYAGQGKGAWVSPGDVEDLVRQLAPLRLLDRFTSPAGRTVLVAGVRTASEAARWRDHRQLHERLAALAPDVELQVVDFRTWQSRRAGGGEAAQG